MNDEEQREIRMSSKLRASRTELVVSQSRPKDVRVQHVEITDPEERARRAAQHEKGRKMLVRILVERVVDEYLAEQQQQRRIGPVLAPDQGDC